MSAVSRGSAIARTTGGRRAPLAAVVGLAALLYPVISSAGPSYQVPVGPRALAMGGAFGAIADDATAAYWNPAGLPLVGHQEISATHANLFGSDIQDNYASFVLPLSVRQAVAADWYSSGFDDDELSFRENRLQVSFGRRVHDLVSAGLAVKYLQRSTDLDGSSVRSGSGWGLDLGLIAFPRADLRIAFSAQDVTDTRIHDPDRGGSSVAFPHNLRGGLAFEPRRDLTLSFDTDDRWHAGAEFRLLDLLALRGGLQKDWRDGDEMIWSAGTGVRIGLLHLDYARVDHPTLGATDHFGASFEFNFNPAQVRIEKAVARDVYASLFKTYARDPVAHVQLRNLDTRPIRAKVQLFVPELMTSPTAQEVVLRPRATQDVPLTAVFSDAALEAAGDRPLQARVAVSYQSLRLPRTERGTARLVAYGPGAIDWSAGVDQAAAFVTPLDPPVDAFARRAVRDVGADVETISIRRNVAYMAAIVDALAVLGVTYVPDPSNPFSAISETPHAVDTVSYPRETLARGTGDCDDTSVLVASLLGNVGIATQFVDVPGHLFLLADTGVHERNRLALGLEEERLVTADERVWIPIETTALARGFAEAWRQGAEAYASWNARGRLARVDIGDAASRYEPAVPQTGTDAAPNLDLGALQDRVREDLDTVAAWRADHLTSRYGAWEQALEVTPEALNQIAHVYFSAGRLEPAAEQLERARALSPDAPQTLNNLGNVRAVHGELDDAIALYAAAVRGDSTDAGTWLNLGLVRYLSGDTLGAAPPLMRGVERSGGYEAACRLLGLVPDETVARGSAKRMSDEEVRALLRAALIKVPHAGAQPDTTAPAARDSARTPRRWVSRVAGGRSAGESELPDVLYWR